MTLTSDQWDLLEETEAVYAHPDTLPAPPPTEPENDIPEHPFHAHLDKCAQCREHPFDLCALGGSLLGGGFA